MGGFGGDIHGGQGRGGFERRLRAELERVARDLGAEHASIHGTLELIIRAAIEIVPGAEHAGITLVTRGSSPESRAATSELPKAIDDLQHRLGDGPCIQAIWEHETVLVPDMEHETRWQRFAPAAAAAGARSMLAFQLYATEQTMGALNLHSTRAHAFDDAAVSVGGSLATHAAIALIASLREQQLRDAIASRDVIGQAKGMLMERYSIDTERAFAILKAQSQNTNEPLHDVARKMVESERPPGI
ncbi:GAF and ANTAR domain-containing protein [Rhodococcus sp. NPDC127530]|uniref:GAF and ANTAR domain-containing protein n=1 Tax=unclassified Rhodococcus (in: high G+C Gram-positive bacteria) TaxID=192944 RepID=UPI003626C4AB